ncbi:MAG: hypothetical protein A2583_08830 [Bdellovibrionales bacterium RIFOXYD1_FULL_53_11]|nr:MAG: hypothetical protein A2583_08830 [Bdellovibrionales bacterium RIFOXYD1_FULL_53_11]
MSAAKTKQVGTRKKSTDFETNARFLETVVSIRADRPFIPRGVYRFKTHKEAQDWSIKMMTRRKAVHRS